MNSLPIPESRIPESRSRNSIRNLVIETIWNLLHKSALLDVAVS